MADDVLGIAAWAGALERHTYINAQGHEPKYSPVADWDARAWEKAWEECKQKGADTEYNTSTPSEFAIQSRPAECEQSAQEGIDPAYPRGERHCAIYLRRNRSDYCRVRPDRTYQLRAAQGSGYGAADALCWAPRE